MFGLTQVLTTDIGGINTSIEGIKLEIFIKLYSIELM